MSEWDLSSAGRASALQAEGHRFEPCRSHLCRRGGTGRRAGLKILWWRHRTGSIPVAGINLLAMRPAEQQVEQDGEFTMKVFDFYSGMAMRPARWQIYCYSVQI